PKASREKRRRRSPRLSYVPFPRRGETACRAAQRGHAMHTGARGVALSRSKTGSAALLRALPSSSRERRASSPPGADRVSHFSRHFRHMGPGCQGKGQVFGVRKDREREGERAEGKLETRVLREEGRVLRNQGCSGESSPRRGRRAS